MKYIFLALVVIIISCKDKDSGIIHGNLSGEILNLANTQLSIEFSQDSINMLQKGPHFVTLEKGNFEYLSQEMDLEKYQQRDTISDIYLAYLTFYSDTLSIDNKSFEYLAIFQNVHNSHKSEDFKLINMRKFKH